MKKDYRVLIIHILECIEMIRQYTKGLNKAKFLRSTQIQDAIIRRIEIIGEAAKHIPPEIKKEYPDIPWKQMVGMRDVLIHEYFGVDLDLTWAVVKKELTQLKKKLLKIKRV